MTSIETSQAIDENETDVFLDGNLIATFYGGAENDINHKAKAEFFVRCYKRREAYRKVVDNFNDQ